MRRLTISGTALILLAFAGSAPAEAQEYRSGVGWFGGGFYSTSLNSGAASGSEAIDPGLTWTAGGHYDHWFGDGRVGVRLQGAWARHTVAWDQRDRRVSVVSGDIDLTLRLTSTEPDRTVTPYVLVGGGFVRWAMGSGPPTTYPPAGVVYPGSEEFEPVAVGGFGIDFLTPLTWGDQPLMIRLEGRDHVQFSSPFDPIDAGTGDFGIVHNISFTLGLYTGMGGL